MEQMEVDENATPKNKSQKAQKRIMKQQRRKHPEISNKIVLLWEELRQKNTSKDRRHELCAQIIDLSKSVIAELIRQKVTSRVFQSLIEFGLDQHRWAIFEIIKKDILELCKGKYSYFSMVQMIKNGTKDQRLSVFKLMTGHIVELIQHAHASNVVEAAYNEFANSKQRNQMIQEFYGKTFALFSDGEDIKHLSEFTANSNYDMKILQHLHKVVTPIIEKKQTELTIVQHVLFEYVSVLIDAIKKAESEITKKPYNNLLEEVLESINEQILKLCNTRQGVRLAIMIFSESSNKLRKKIILSIKDVISEMAVHKDSHLFLLTVLNHTDDTKLLDKSIIKPLMKNIQTIGENVHGRKIIHFMLNCRDKRFLSQFVLNILKQSDGNQYSKKDPETRSQEILDSVRGSMLKWVDETIDELLKYAHSINVVHSVVSKCLPTNDEMKTQYNKILKAIVTHIDEPVIPANSNLKRKLEATKAPVLKKKAKVFTGTYEKIEETETPEEENESEIDTHLLESIGGNVLVKSLCKLEKEGKIEFSSLCLEIADENLQTFIKCNRSGFFLVFLFETGNETIQKFLKEHMAPLKNTILTSDFPSLKILSKLLFTLE